MKTQPLVSADSHVVEPLEVFAAVARRFKGEARLVHDERRGWLLDTGLGATFQPGRLATAGIEPRSAEYEAQERSGYDRASLRDVGARLADLDRDGVAAEVLFPSIVGSFLSGRKAGVDATAALCRSYNDWIADYCGDARQRLFPLACMPVHDLDAAVAEAQRAKKRGHVGILVPCGTPEDQPYSDRAYDVLWAAAQELDLAVAFHAGFGADRVLKSESLSRHDLRYAIQHLSAQIAISDLINGGTCGRFPRLRFVFAEFGIGWIAHFLEKTDWRQFRRGQKLQNDMRFSETWRQSFRATFEDDEVGLRARDEIGVETLLWASDYPHGDSVWPESRATVERTMANCTPVQRRALTVENAVALYRLPVEV